MLNRLIKQIFQAQNRMNSTTAIIFRKITMPKNTGFKDLTRLNLCTEKIFQKHQIRCFISVSKRILQIYFTLTYPSDKILVSIIRRRRYIQNILFHSYWFLVPVCYNNPQYYQKSKDQEQEEWSALNEFQNKIVLFHFRLIL